VGSAFNSPNAGSGGPSTLISNPNERCEKFYVMRMGPSQFGHTQEEQLAQDLSKAPRKVDLSQLTPTTKAKAEKMNGVRDIVKLLKALEEEVAVCEANLKEELDKRKKYRIDDSRRTHSYDDFISTFLLMLAEQGKLPDLLEKSLANGSSSSAVLQNGFDVPCDSPQSPTAFFAELHGSFGDVPDNKEETSTNTRTRTRTGGRVQGQSQGLAEFMTRLNGTSPAKDNASSLMLMSPSNSASTLTKNGTTSSASRTRPAVATGRKRKRKKAAAVGARFRYKRRV
jgi:hypothetical protein